MAESSAGAESSALAGLLSSADDLEALQSLDAAFTTQTTHSGSFIAQHSPSTEAADIELDVPEVEDMPTLESILNEKDDDAMELESDPELASILHEEALSSSLDLGLSPKKKKLGKHGAILRHIVLKNVSGQMVSASSKVDAGLPTALAVSSVITIGTSHGIVLVFDPQQTLRLVLGNATTGAEYGGVSALGINRDCTRLLCGHARGQICMWDLHSGKLLRSILDAHPLGAAVLHIMFTDDPTVAICSDSGGSVFVLSFKRLIGVRSYESTCLFSGSRGEVCTMAPLHMHAGMKDHPLYDYSLLALATLTKVLVLTLRPSMEVLFTHTLKGPADSLPLLSWQFAIILVANEKVIDPVIAFGRGNSIYFYQAHGREERNVKFMFLQRIETNYKLVSFQWLSPHVMATIDVLEKLHVIDVRTSEELEVVDLSDAEIVYSSSYFKSLSTGGNVSKALAAASEHACYQTAAVFNGQLLVLGRKAIHVLTMRTWTDRISLLVRLHRFVDALELALSFYEGTAKAVVGLAGTAESRKQTVAAEIEELLNAFVDIVVFVNCPKGDDKDERVKYFKEMVPLFIEYSLAIDHMDLLFRDIYYKLCEDPIGKIVFLESLQPYILDDKLTSLSPIVMKDFIEHYQEMDKLREVEACLLHLDVMNLDIHQMVKLCWSHSLYDAILYVYNRGMRDYATPLEELMAVLRSSLISGKPLTDQDQALGYKMLVYISCCLAGRAYPLGEIPPDIVTQVKTQVFNCLTVINTKDAFETESQYPYVRILLQFDTQEFLNVLSMAFEEKEFDDDFRGPGDVSGRQHVVNILLDVMVQGTEFLPSQVGSLFTFLARQMAKHENTFLVDKVLFEQVLEYLANPDDDSRHEERQQALLELLLAGGLRQFDDERILVLAENAKFYRVCELLYEKKRQFNKILSCYYRDVARRDQAFVYIHNAMTDDSYTDLEREEVKEAALDSLQELVSVSCIQTASLIMNDFPDSLSSVVSRLDNQPSIQYQFLKGVFDSRALLLRPEFSPDVHIHERYIELMCQYEHDEAVFSYLRATDNYRIEETLAIVRGHDFPYATAYLLEKAGDVLGAFQLLLEKLRGKVNKIKDAFRSEKPSPEIRKCNSDVWSVMVVITQLCQRNSSRLDEDDREALWFPLLETVMAPQRQCKDTTSGFFSAFKELTRHVMNSMMGYISLPAILQKIMQDPTYSSGKFGEIKELILGMLDTYSYESTLLTTTNRLLAKDLHTSLTALRTNLNKGLTPSSTVCGVCHRQISSESFSGNKDDSVLFRCSHMYHRECLKAYSATEPPVCLQCNQAKVSGASRKERRAPDRSRGPETEDPLKPDKKTGLTRQQFEAITRLRQNRGPSRLAIMTELSRTRENESVNLSYGSSSTSSRSIFYDENFRLRLIPPRVPPEK